jgi:hypothetical protein
MESVRLGETGSFSKSSTYLRLGRNSTLTWKSRSPFCANWYYLISAKIHFLVSVHYLKEISEEPGRNKP